MTAMTDSGSWADNALRACLDRLRVSTLTEAREVTVARAWTDGEEAFCVVYTPPYDRTRTVGIRRHRSDAAAVNDDWQLGDFAPSPYIDNPADPDAKAFGETVADFDIGEPLGNTVRILRKDVDGIGWWGTLGSDLPRP